MNTKNNREKNLMQEETLYSGERSEAMQGMQAKVAQRIRLLDDPNMSHIDKLRLATGQNRNLTEEQLLTEVYEVKQLVEVGNAKVMHAVQHGREEMGKRLAASSRKDCINMLMDMLGKINEWSKNREHEGLNFSEETREQLATVFSCIENEEPISLNKEEIIELTLSLTEQYCMMMTAEYVEITDAQIDADAFVDGEADERRELVMAVAMNLKKTGKLPFKSEMISDEEYAGMVCAMDAVNGYCAEAATGKLSLGKLFVAVGNILMGVFFVGVSLVTIAEGGFLMTGLGLIEACMSCVWLTRGIRAIYMSLFPAGISETRLGRAVINTVRSAAALVERIVARVVRTVKEIVQVVADAVKAGARAVKQSAQKVVQNVRTYIARCCTAGN